MVCLARAAYCMDTEYLYSECVRVEYVECRDGTEGSKGDISGPLWIYMSLIISRLIAHSLQHYGQNTDTCSGDE